MGNTKLGLTLVAEGASSANRGVDIIVIHGLSNNGHRRPWTSRCSSEDETQTSLNLLAIDLALARVFTYEYHSSLSNDGHSIIEAGDKLLSELKKIRANKAGEPRPIIFVGHSLGGLVIKRALIGAFYGGGDESLSAIITETQGIIFLGTPHSTSPAELHTSVARIVISSGSDPATVSMVAVKRLQRILTQFAALPWDDLSWKIVSFYEVLPLPGSTFRAVERSQTELWTFPQVPLNRHHHDMHLITPDDDPSCTKILESLHNIIPEAAGVGRSMMHSTFAPAEQEVLQSLSFEDASTHVPDAELGTCGWLLEHDTFKSWMEGPSQTLWLTGKPGSGKSVLSKYVINHLLSENTTDSAQVIYFFFSRGDESQSMTRLMTSILYQQLLKSTSSFTASDILTELAEKRETHGFNTPWDDDMLIECFLRLVDKSSTLGQSVYLVIDALDECDYSDRVVYLLQCLNTESNPFRRIRTFISSRHSPSFGPVWEINMEANNFFDIRKHLEDRIRNLENHFLPGLKVQEYTQAIAEKARGVFLWAKLVVSDLLRNSYLRSVKGVHALQWWLPTDLSAAYETTLERLWHSHTTRHRRLLHDALILVTCAQRPLSILELRNALAMADGGLNDQRTNRIQDSMEIDARVELLILCGGLLEVSPQISRSSNGAATVPKSNVLLIHETLREFLLGKGSAVLEVPGRDYGKADFQLRAAEICLLSIDQVNETVAFPQLSVIGREASSPQFLRYAVLYGMKHLSLASQMGARPKEEDKWRSPIFQGRFIDRWAHVCDQFFGARNQFKPGKTKAAHLMSYFGLPWLDTDIWGGSLGDINEKDHYGQTPLSLAAAMGHLDLCQALLGLGADVEHRDYIYGQTPLSLAAAHGHKEVVELLLRAGSHHGGNIHGVSVLHMAVRSADPRIVQLLLESGASVNIANVQTGETVLSRAAALGHVPIVSLLLKSGAEIESWDKRGWSPLHYAISQSRKKTLEVLLEALRPAQLYRLRISPVTSKYSWVDTVLRAMVLGLYFYQCGDSRTSSSGNSRESTTPSQSSFNQPVATSARKRGRHKLDSDSEDDCEGKDQDVSEKRPRHSNSGGRRFACPYHKRNAQKYPNGACNGKGFDTIHRLKQHLKKWHSRVLEWQRCHICKTRFPHAEIEGHIPCVRRDEPSDYEEGYDAVQLQQLESNDLFPRKSSTEKCWYGIFKVLFPDWPQTKEIPSPYQDTQNRPISLHHQQVIQEFRRTIMNPNTIRDIMASSDHGQHEQGLRLILGRLLDDLVSQLGLPSMNGGEGLYQGSAVDSRIPSQQLALNQENPRATTIFPPTGPLLSISASQNHTERDIQAADRLMGDYAGTQGYLPYPELSPFRTGYGYSHECPFNSHSSAIPSAPFGSSLDPSMYSWSGILTDDTCFSDYDLRSQGNMGSSGNLLQYSQHATGDVSQLRSCPQLSSDTAHPPGTVSSLNGQGPTSSYAEADVLSASHQHPQATQIGLGQTDSTQSLEPSSDNDVGAIVDPCSYHGLGNQG